MFMRGKINHLHKLSGTQTTECSQKVYKEIVIIDSTLNGATNSLVNKLIGAGRVVCCALSHNEHHKTHNGWYSGMWAPLYFIVGILILYSKNALRRSVTTERWHLW